MNKETSKVKKIYRSLYYAIFLLLTFVVIYLLIPKQITFKYEFQKGQPWGHNTLIAPFDFPILKPQEVLAAERDSVLKNYVPFLSIDNSVQEQQMALFNEQLKAALASADYDIGRLKIKLFTQQFESLFIQFYQRGIIEAPVSDYDYFKDKTYINLINQNEVKKVPVSQLVSLKGAYILISDSIDALIKKLEIPHNFKQLFDPSEFLATNLLYDRQFNDAQSNEMLAGVSTTRGVVQEGVRVISEGDWVNNDNYLVIESLKQAYKRNSTYGGWLSTVVIGQMILILIVLTMIVLYMQVYNRKIFWKKRNFTMILFTVLAMIVLARLIHENQSLSLYLLPVCILPIIIRTFLGARMAIFVHLSTMLIISFMAPNSFEFFFLQVTAGTIAVISLRNLHRRGQLVLTSLLVFGSYCVMYFGFELIADGNAKDIDYSTYKWFLANGLLLLSTYPLLYIIEKMFGFISDVTLVELSDTNHPLLRELAEIAPGTFQHSMQVANLAEAVIVKTGGNPLLVRTGALYHDVGKIKSSEFFIENQAGGKNPHDKMSNIKSVEKIVSHVFDGVKLAKKYKLPEPVIDFIKMHHGTGLVKYFYLKYKEEHPNEPVNEEDFRYPGPNPTTRETAVVMLADGVEAAARSLPEKNEQTLKAIIDQIINAKILHHELDDAPITFKDINDIKAIFLDKLKNVYHLRIQYPKEVESEKKE